MTLAQGQQGQTSVREFERAEQYQEERRYLVRVPVAPYYALLVGVALLPLGVLGLIPQLTRGGMLLGFIRITPLVSVLYILTSIAGIAAFAYRRGHYAHHFTLILTGVYLLLFSDGNIDFGNAEGAAGGTPNIPWILENALHAGLMLTGALITGLATLQQGDRATAREFKQRYGLTDPRGNDTDGNDADGGAMTRLMAFVGDRRSRGAFLARAGRAVALMALTLIVTLLVPIVTRSWRGRRAVSVVSDARDEERRGHYDGREAKASYAPEEL